MKLRTISKLGVVISIILFCIGVVFYSFARISVADKGKDFDLLSLVPDDCIGLLETDNIDFVVHEFSQVAYASRLDTLQRGGIFPIVFEGLGRYAGNDAHGLSNRMDRMMISFHSPASARDAVIYFRTGEPGSHFFRQLVRRQGADFVPKQETYRGKTIEIFPMAGGDFISAYYGEGFWTVSYQKRLIERVIDAEKDRRSLRENPVFSEAYHKKTVNFITLYGLTSSMPFIVDGHRHCWSEFDIHLDSEVLYLSGGMYVPDSCISRVEEKLVSIQPVSEDSLLVLSGQEKVDSCIAQVAAATHHTLFDECVSNLSRDASYIMVADMDKIARTPEPYKGLFPIFLYEHLDLFRPFILSVQITKVNHHFSHIFVFTYKE